MNQSTMADWSELELTNMPSTIEDWDQIDWDQIQVNTSTTLKICFQNCIERRPGWKPVVER